MKRSQLTREIVEIVAITLLFFLALRFVVQSYHAQGPSMQPGLKGEEYVVVNKIAYLFHPPERGDVIVFHFPQDPGRDLIKRVVGLPGDTIVTDMTTIKVNGVTLQEPYISAPVNGVANKWTVPANSYYVLGDNRRDSEDSRYWNFFVPKDYIVGKAVMVFWPLTSWQLINTYPSVYTQVKIQH